MEENQHLKLDENLELMMNYYLELFKKKDSEDNFISSDGDGDTDSIFGLNQNEV